MSWMGTQLRLQFLGRDVMVPSVIMMASDPAHDPNALPVEALKKPRPYHESTRIRMNPNSLKDYLSIILIGSRINQDHKYININCASPKSINCPRTTTNCSSPNQSSQPQIVLRQRLGTSRSTCKTTPLGHLDSEAVGCQVLWVSLCSPLHVPP